MYVYEKQRKKWKRIGSWERERQTDNEVYIFKPVKSIVMRTQKHGEKCRTHVLELFTQEVGEPEY